MAFDAATLPDSEKRDLCRALLAEFGVTHVTERGEELIHSCCLPFGLHRNGDRNPSASLNWQKLTYNCLGCGNSGGLLWFIGVCRGEGATQARKWLSKETGFEGEDGHHRLLAYFDTLAEGEQRARVSIPKLNDRILEQWNYIHPYWTDVRGIPLTTLEHFRCGYDPDTDRVVIPHFWKDQLVGWQTRRWYDDGSPKYKSSTGMPKDLTIFNYQGRGSAVVVESPMSVLAKWHLLPNIEATFGASVTDRQIRLLSKHARVITWFDNDEAGWSATEHVGDALASLVDLRVVQSPWSGDIADLPDHEVGRLLSEAVPYALWKRPEELIPSEKVRDREQDPARA